MSNPIGAILAGLGGGLSSAGESMDERARLTLATKRQAALDAIARAQKLNEMDLEPVNPTSSPFANPQAVQPSSIPIQTGMSGGTNPVPSTQPTTSADLALRKLVSLPNAAGGIDQYQEKAFADTAEGKKEARDAAKQAAELRREQALAQAKAIDPATMRKALDGDMDAVAQVLTKHPELQTTFNKPAPAPKSPLQDYTTKDGKPVFQTPNGLQDAEGNKLASKDVVRYVPPANNTYITGTDAAGNPSIFAGTTRGTPTLTDTGIGKPAGTGMGAQSASAQSQQARLMAAVSEARLADKRMREFEDKLLSDPGAEGHQDISVPQQAAGNLMTNLAGSHGFVGAIGQAGSEAALNAVSPEYAQYLRDASTIGRAEQMMSPRGGNETMVRANALLARAGTGAQKNTIDASRMARQALFGAAGGIEQTLTPTQSQKLRAGVQSISRGETSGANAKTMTKAEYNQLSPTAKLQAAKLGYTVVP